MNVDETPARAMHGARSPQQFVRFLGVGALNTAFGYTVYALLVVAGVPAQPALLLTYVVGVPFNFWTTGRLVFAQARAAAFPRFVLAYVIVYAFNMALLHAAQRLGAVPLLAQALCLPVVAVFAFALFKFRVFRSRP